MKRLWILFILSFISFSCFSQQFIKYSFRSEAGVPYGIANGAYRKTYNGIFDLGVSANVGIAGGLFVGAVYRMNNMKPITTRFSGARIERYVKGVGIKAGYDFWSGEHTIITPSFTFGYAETTHIKLYCPPTVNPDHRNNFIDGTLTVKYITEEKVSIGGFINYTYHNHGFNPDLLCLDKLFSYDDADYSGKVQYISYGLTVGYVIFRKE